MNMSLLVSPSPEGGARPLAPDWALPVWRDAPAVEKTIPALLALAVSRFGDREYVVFDDARMTFRQAEQRSAQLALRLLEAGVTKGIRVGMLFPNTPEFVVIWLALARIGAVPVPISTLSTPAELQRIARHADLAMMMVVDNFLNHDYVARLQSAFPSLPDEGGVLFLPEAPHLRSIWVQATNSQRNLPAWAQAYGEAGDGKLDRDFLAAVEREVTPGDVVSIIYTSGSTGDPKGVIHSHGNFVRQAGKLSGSYLYAEGDKVFAPQPFFWVGGLILHVLQMLYTGSTILGSVKSNREILDMIERERVNYVHVYAHVARAMEADPSFGSRDFSAIRGGRLTAAIPVHLRPKNQSYANALGMTETSGPHTVAYHDLPDDMRGALGPSSPGMEHKIVDVDSREPLPEGAEGELLVRGNTLMLGMVKRERSEVFTADGWFATGDLCSMRAGFLYFHGRVDDMIKASGANVSPREVEDVLMAFPGVAQAYVCGVADRARGAVVGAIIVSHADVSIDLSALDAHARTALSSYKVPRVVLLMAAADVPSTSSTKVDRRGVARLLQEAHDKEAQDRQA